MAASIIARKLLSLLTSGEVIAANPNKGTSTMVVDGAGGFTCAVVMIDPAGITIEMNETGKLSRRVDAPKGLTFAALAMMIEFAAEGNLLTA